MFSEIVTYVLTERAIARIGRGWLTREDRQAWEQLRGELLEELADNDAFTAALDELWPILTPETLLARCTRHPNGCAPRARTRRCCAPTATRGRCRTCRCSTSWSTCWAPTEPADDSAERERKAEAQYAAGVLDIMTSREDLMDDEDHLLATDLLYAEDLAERFVERDTRELGERAAADRDWTYRHIVVDEAQELSEMDWRVLMRRCPSRSFTVVGDLAQRRSAAGATSWDTMLEPYVPGRWVYRSLTVNYRTPAEIMAVAAALLAEFAPGVAASRVGARERGAAVVAAGHRGRTAFGYRGIRSGRKPAARARAS